MRDHMTRGSRSRRVAVTALIVTAVIVASALAPSLAGAETAQAHALKFSTRTLNFGYQRVGTASGVRLLKLFNNGSTPITLERVRFQSGNRTDFIALTNCFLSGKPATLDPGKSCSVGFRFIPRARTTRTVILVIEDSTSGSPHFVSVRGVGTQGYYMVGPRGGVSIYGDAVFHGGAYFNSLSAPIVSMTATPNGAGYWLLGSDGGIFSFGGAKFFGSTGAMRLTQPVLGMASTPTGKGYWLVAGDGGIFTFGDAKFFGSTGALRLNQPVVGMASTPSGKGYWLVARDGGIFTFGDAKFFGSTGALRLVQPVVGMASTPSGRGYWLVAGDGGIFTFGDAKFFGSTGGGAFGLINGMAITSDGGGYWLSNTAGQVFPFGNAPYFGDLYRFNPSLLAPVVATAPKLRPVTIEGGVLELRSHAAIGSAGVPHAVPRLNGG
jgi:hypothetical protein